MNYPNGKKSSGSSNIQPKLQHGYGKRGMTLEEDINITNTYYLEINKAVIHKKPTPVQIVKVNYPKRSAAVITEAYFKQASTTDYNGIYRNKYIDFEAKETRNKTAFPLANIHSHQISHMEAVVEHGGICFMILRFTVRDETFLLPATKLLRYWQAHLNDGKKSIPYAAIVQDGYPIPFDFKARVNYLEIVEQLYF
ncbi:MULTISPECIES: Holliday junction resolvase RecU [unclassified Virgibacillus]|uniref:Holliday junction resolvase RecU n=1 Tax=unclassified Virgibacillus TaxID=2620237 RepID=UPI0024DE82AB|nr:Holliday junction resolvase RecU [Virgibacillus sp. LDC-1]